MINIKTDICIEKVFGMQTNKFAVSYFNLEEYFTLYANIMFSLRILFQVQKEKLETAVIDRSILEKAVNECTAEGGADENKNLLNIIK